MDAKKDYWKVEISSGQKTNRKVSCIQALLRWISAWNIWNILQNCSLLMWISTWNICNILQNCSLLMLITRNKGSIIIIILIQGCCSFRVTRQSHHLMDLLFWLFCTSCSSISSSCDWNTRLCRIWLGQIFFRHSDRNKQGSLSNSKLKRHSPENQEQFAKTVMKGKAHNAWYYNQWSRIPHYKIYNITMTFNTPINNNFMWIFNLWFYLNIKWDRNSLTYKMRVSKVHRNYLKIDQTKGNAQGASRQGNREETDILVQDLGSLTSCNRSENFIIIINNRNKKEKKE